MKPAQVLVTGGSGFIGRHLVRALINAGRPVRILARSHAKAERLFAGEVEVCEGDLRHAGSLHRACAGIEEIYHVAGLYCFGMSRQRDLFAVNVQGTENILAAAWKHRVEKVVHVSSTSLLAGRRETLTEADFPGCPSRCAPYKASKWHAERCVMDWAARGLPVATASPPCPIGAGDEGPTPTGQMILDFLQGRFPFSVRTGLNFIAIEDVATGLMAVARRGRCGERYILAHENLWFDDFLRILSELTGLPAPRWRLPWSLIAAAGVAGEIAGLAGSRCGERICLETALKARRPQFFDSTKALQELGWSAQKPLRSSLAEAVEWFRPHNGRVQTVRGGLPEDARRAYSD